MSGEILTHSFSLIEKNGLVLQTLLVVATLILSLYPVVANASVTASANATVQILPATRVDWSLYSAGRTAPLTTASVPFISRTAVRVDRDGRITGGTPNAMLTSIEFE
jgi:hypothetical protein